MEVEAEANNRSLIQPAEDVVRCPSCDVALKPYEIAKHCEAEIEELKRMQSEVIGEHEAGETHLQNGDRGSRDSRKPWSVFRKVQKNRQTRLKLRSRKRPQTDPTCPVCNLSFPQEEIQRHAEQCLLRNNSTTRHHASGDIEDDGSEDDGEYEEYEWAGQKRIRTSSLLQGGYGSLGFGTVTTKHTTDEDDEDLNVDEDDTQIYGPAQYGESDVIPPAIDADGTGTEEHSVATYMRQLIAGNNATADSNHNAVKIETTNRAVRTDVSLNHETVKEFKCSLSSNDHKNAESIISGKDHCQVIESLKAKLRHYENHIQSKFKCLICLDDYRNPAISVLCWHVHCEECWLRSLGARKLCPKCNVITSPKDLRRIYL